jgi:hypothetical protein
MKISFGRNYFLVLLLVTSTSIAGARSNTVDKDGKQVAIVFKDTPYQTFQRTYSFETYQQLDQTDREYALPELLIASQDPKANLTYEQKRNMQYVLSQNFEPLPEDVKSRLAEKAIWMSLLGGNDDLTRNLVKKFIPPYSEDRTKGLCKLATSIATMVTGSNQIPTVKDFLKLSPESLRLFSSLMKNGTSLTDEKCKFNSHDEGLTLKQIDQEISKQLSLQTLNAPSAQVAATSKKACQLSDIESIFKESMEKIEKGGPQARVYIGIEKLVCPLYGLMMKDPKGKFRFYPNNLRDDAIAPIEFSSLKELMSRFKAVPTNPKATSPNGTARGSGTR